MVSYLRAGLGAHGRCRTTGRRGLWRATCRGRPWACRRRCRTRRCGSAWWVPSGLRRSLAWCRTCGPDWARTDGVGPRAAGVFGVPHVEAVLGRADVDVELAVVEAHGGCPAAFAVALHGVVLAGRTGRARTVSDHGPPGSLACHM